MKLREIKKEVYSLAFIPAEQDDIRFINAVRRALSIIFCELRVTGKKTLLIAKDNIRSTTGLRHIGGETVALPLAGRAYAIRLSGKGCFTIYDGPMVLSKEFDDNDVSFKGFLRYGGKIEFSGEYGYTVLNLITYPDILSDRIEDIPEPCDSPEINMSNYPDFFSFCAPPTDSRGNEIRGAVTDGAKLILPVGYSGKVNIFYRKRALPLPDDGDHIVDIPDVYLPLLAPLSASLMLIDDDRDLADCYMELYSRMAEDMKKAQNTENVKYVRTNGWA